MKMSHGVAKNYLTYKASNMHVFSHMDDAITSLNSACSFAGGSSNIFTAQILYNMTALELIAHIAPNKIRFHYDASCTSHA